MLDYFKKFFASTSPESPLSTPSQWLVDLFGGPTYTGANVTAETSMRSSAVYACVSLISQAIATLPLLIVRKDGDRRVTAKDHPLFFLLHEEPNATMTINGFLELMLCHVLLHGNAYAVIGRDKGNRVLDLNPITNPHAVKPERVNDSIRYTVRLQGGGEEIVNQADMLHIHGLGFDGVTGMSPIAFAAKQAVGLALATEEHGARLFSNGARLSGLLKHPKTLQPEAQKRLARQWSSMYSGTANAGKTAVLEEGMDFQALTMTAEDSQFLETRRFQVEDISRFFRVPLHMINETSKATSWGSGLEQLSIGFVQYTLRPWLVRLEQEFNRKLLRQRFPKTPSPFSSKFVLEGLLRGDSAARAALYSSGHQNTWMSPNEIRSLEDMPPVAGGDTLYVQSNLVPIQRAKNVTEGAT